MSQWRDCPYRGRTFENLPLLFEERTSQQALVGEALELLMTKRSHGSKGCTATCKRGSMTI